MPGVEDWGEKEEWISTLRVGEIAEDEGIEGTRSFDRDKIALKVSLFIHRALVSATGVQREDRREIWGSPEIKRPK